MSDISSIIDDIVTDATEIADLINTRSDSIGTPSSIFTSTSTKMTDEEALANKKIEDLENDKLEISKQIEEIEKCKEIDTGKTVILRSLRAKKLSIGRELRIALELKDEQEYKRKVEEKQLA